LHERIAYRRPDGNSPFSKYRNPAQTSLGSLQDQGLEEKLIVVNWHYPFLSVVLDYQRIISHPTAPCYLEFLQKCLPPFIQFNLGYKAIRTNLDLEVQTDAVDCGHSQHHGQYQGDDLKHQLIHLFTSIFLFSSYPAYPNTEQSLISIITTRSPLGRSGLSSSNLSCECDNKFYIILDKIFYHLKDNFITDWDLGGDRMDRSHAGLRVIHYDNESFMSYDMKIVRGV
jgi:hypothetical protein